MVGWPYQMGYAHGQLVKDVVKSFIDEVWEYLEDEIVRLIKDSLIYKQMDEKKTDRQKGKQTDR